MRILVIDPEAEIRLVFFVAADQVDAEIEFAETGQEALTTLASSPDYDAVFAADALEDATPNQLAELLRGQSQYLYQPLIFLSHDDEAEHLVALLQIGDDVIVKPFSQQVLLAKILAHKRIHALYKSLHQQHALLDQFRKRTESEHMIAGDVLKQLLARSQQDIEGVSRFVSPYSVFNGDLLLIARGPEQQLYFLVADVTGHGLSAALGTLPIAETFLGLTAQGQAVGAIARAMNRLYLERIPPYILCAAAICCFDIERSLVRCWTGGIPPLLVVDSNRQIKSRHPALHMALGACDESMFEAFESSIVLSPGDQLIAYTDGIIEARDLQGALFGLQCLEQALCVPGRDPLTQKVITALTQHAGTDDFQDDDITLLCLDRDRCTAALNQSGWMPPIAVASPPCWELSITLGPAQIIQRDLLANVLEHLPLHSIPGAQQTRLEQILAELLANALDYGVLRLDSTLKHQGNLNTYLDTRQQAIAQLAEGWIRLSLRYSVDNNQGSLNLTCQDSGAGIPPIAWQPPAQDTPGRRGLLMVAKLSDALTYDTPENRLNIQLLWPTPKNEAL